jgi:hypothetical protein
MNNDLFQLSNELKYKNNHFHLICSENINKDRERKNKAKKGLLYLLNNLSGNKFCPEINKYYVYLIQVTKEKVKNDIPKYKKVKMNCKEKNYFYNNVSLKKRTKNKCMINNHRYNIYTPGIQIIKHFQNDYIQKEFGENVWANALKKINSSSNISSNSSLPFQKESGILQLKENKISKHVKSSIMKKND